MTVCRNAIGFFRHELMRQERKRNYVSPCGGAIPLPAMMSASRISLWTRRTGGC